MNTLTDEKNLEDCDPSTEIKKLTIVGAGTAGALTAAYLRKHLPSDIDINLIAPTDNERIGVGEATVPTFRFFMHSLGLKESDWLPKVNGTYKCAVKFTNWGQSKGSYFHPFPRDKDLKIKNLDYEYEHNFLDILNFNLNGANHHEFLDKTLLSHFICENFLSPVSPNNKGYVSYAYHFDAQLLADFLMDHAQKLGVQIVYDEVEESTSYQNGFIRSLHMKSGQEVFSDFYIDCSGAKGVLINDALKVQFLSYSDRLFTDQALAAQLKYDFKKDLPPYTESIATNSGWVWKTPLRTRMGSGIVYNSNFESPDLALQNLSRELSVNENQLTNIRSITMPVGRRKDSWTKNCVSIGLSSSFIEPLESTSIALTEYQIFLVRKLLPQKKFDTQKASIFNLNFNSSYDKVADFITLHYILSDRNDTPFWKYIQNEKQKPRFQEIIYDSQQFLQSGFRSNSYHIFDRFSYACILTGLGFPIEVDLAELSHPDFVALALKKRRELENMRTYLKKHPYLHAEHCRSKI